MACDGNCAKCPVQCGASKILEKINTSKPEEVKPDKPQNGKEQETMSEEIVKAAGCGAPKDPEEIRQNAAILHLAEKVEGLGKGDAFTNSHKATMNITLALAISAMVLAGIAIGICLYLAKGISDADKNAACAVDLATKASIRATAAEDRANKNFVYLRDMKRDFRK